MPHRKLSASSTTAIHKPIATVFAVLSDPQQFVELTSETILIGEAEHLVAGGFRVRAATRWRRLVGYRFTVTTAQYDPPNSIIFVADDVERSLLGKLLRLRVSNQVEYLLTPEGSDSTQVTATVTWQRLPARSLWLMAPLARRTMGAQLGRLEQLAGSRP
jgi:uncharacterized protein YndB with AHSA1/START domain